MLVWLKETAEFVVALAEKHQTWEHFKSVLLENGAEFSDSLVANLLRLTQHMKSASSKTRDVNLSLFSIYSSTKVRTTLFDHISPLGMMVLFDGIWLELYKKLTGTWLIDLLKMIFDNTCTSEMIIGWQNIQKQALWLAELIAAQPLKNGASGWILSRKFSNYHKIGVLFWFGVCVFGFKC